MGNTRHQYPLAYVAYAKDAAIRFNSTSGGICQCLSELFIKEHGVVSGVRFDPDLHAIRDFARTKEELKTFKKSKYVEVRQGDAYQKTKEYLEAGEKVLFIGAPCHVIGLKGFLQKEYQNLLCVDFICLGIPSELVWQTYCEEITKTKRVQTIDFKDKSNGWHQFAFRVKYSDGTEFSEPGRENIYMQAMIQKVYNRPACYACSCRTKKRISDITVADAWRMERYVPTLIDDKGTSAILVNTEKGNEYWNKIQNKFICEPTEAENIWTSNENAWKQYSSIDRDSAFFDNLSKNGFQYAYKMYRVKRTWKKVFSKLLNLFDRR